MKKARRLMITIGIIVFGAVMTSCGSNSIKQERLDKIPDDASSAVEKSYDKLNLPDDISFDIPDEIYTYSYKKKTDIITNTDDDKCRTIIELMYDNDDFDKTLHPDEVIMKEHINESYDGGNFVFSNYDRDENVTLSGSGEMSMGKLGDKGNEICVSSFLLADKQTNDSEQKAIDKACSFMGDICNIMGCDALSAFALSHTQNSAGEDFCTVHFCQTLDDMRIDTFGMMSADNLMPDEIKYYGYDNYVVVDKDNNVYSCSFNGPFVTERKEPIKKISSLSTTLEYVDKELAPNVNVDIKSIELIYAVQIKPAELMPVWAIEFSETEQDITAYNSIYVNAVDGSVDCLIDSFYEKHEP